MNSMVSVSLMVKGVIFALCLFQPAAGNAFLKKTGPAPKQMVNESTIQRRFNQEVRAHTGKGPVDVQLPAITEALRPTWLALQKNEHGYVGNVEVRYALHRFFQERHGWQIDGLYRNSTGAAANPVGYLMEYVRELTEAVNGGKGGFELHEAAFVAATLEHMIHDEATDRLRDIYRAYDISSRDRISHEQAQLVIRAFLMSQILGQGTLTSADDIERGFGKLERTYPGWDDMKMFGSDVKEAVAFQNQGSTNPFTQQKGLSFQQVEGVTQQVSQRLGRFQDADCRELKDTLLEREEGDSGRVPLSDFYKIGMAGTMQFAETPDYLRHAGALDESKPGEPRVIVANYVLSKGNCLADMSFHSICCINECEGLMAQVEQKIAAPHATPKELAAVVSHLSSSTVEASGALAEKDLRRLQQIASINRGVVPLHGRLFAQWMHSVFPRECPMQHAGATNPLSASEWTEKSTYKRQEMQKYVDAAHKQASEKTAEEPSEDYEVAMDWSHEEYLPDLPADTTKGTGSYAGVFVKTSLMLAAVATVAVAFVDKAGRSSCLTHVGIGKEKAHLV